MISILCPFYTRYKSSDRRLGIVIESGELEIRKHLEIGRTWMKQKITNDICKLDLYRMNPNKDNR